MKYTILILSLMTTLFIACDNKDEMSLPSTDFELLNLSCHSSKETLIIRTETDYKIALDSTLRRTANCLGEPVPNIDFTQKMLIGINACGSGCSRNISHELNSTEDVFSIDITVTEIGFCEPWFCETQWLLIDKVSEDITFDIQVTREQN